MRRGLASAGVEEARRSTDLESLEIGGLYFNCQRRSPVHVPLAMNRPGSSVPLKLSLSSTTSPRAAAGKRLERSWQEAEMRH